MSLLKDQSILLFTTLWVTTGVLSGRCDSLVVEGYVTNNILRTGAGDVRWFRAAGDATNWLVRFSGLPGVSDYVEVFGHGGKTFYLNCMKDVLARKEQQGQKVAYNVATGMIRSGDVPFFPMMQEAGVVWLTLFSGNFFQTNTSGFITPPCRSGFLGTGNVRFEDYPLQKYIRSGTLVTALSIPEQVDYFFVASNAPFLNKDIERIYGRMTNASFTLVETSVIAGRTLPSVSLLRITAPEDIVGGPVNYQFGVIATNISFSHAPVELIANIPGATHMTDNRFGTPDRKMMVSYAANHWLSNAELERQPEYRRLLAMFPDGPRASLKSATLVAIVIAGGLIPAFLYAKTAKRGKLAQTQNTKNTVI